jgi:hypothetical protein
VILFYEGLMMDHCVFIHTNHKQIVGALVAEHALRRNSRHNDKFDVRIIEHKDYPFMQAREEQLYLRDGMKRPWLNDDLQSFTPLRFLPPELMGYKGRAVVIDPDVFAVGDAWDLLSRDMMGKAILCRARTGTKGCIDKCETIGLFEEEWNHFDTLTPKTKMLHTTKRRTQPWKTGLPIDHRPREKYRLFPPLRWLMKARRSVFGEYALLGRYQRHPDPAQEQLFFGLLKECLETGRVTENMIRSEMVHNHVRHDAFKVLDRTPPLALA